MGGVRRLVAASQDLALQLRCPAACHRPAPQHAPAPAPWLARSCRPLTHPTPPTQAKLDRADRQLSERDAQLAAARAALDAQRREKKRQELAAVVALSVLMAAGGAALAVGRRLS